ncbi:MAG TPA: hypothetical protein DD381_00960 [Lentisphaeria bacterium]|nr:hypothetical protein [Lentisphaeria bacterium]
MKVTVRKFAEKLAARLYEPQRQKGNPKKGGIPNPDGVSLYIQRFLIWLKSCYEKEYQEEYQEKFRKETFERWRPNPV